MGFFVCLRKYFFSLKNPFMFSFVQVLRYFLLFEFTFPPIFRLQKCSFPTFSSFAVCRIFEFSLLQVTIFPFSLCVSPLFIILFFKYLYSYLLSLSPPLSPPPPPSSLRLPTSHHLFFSFLFVSFILVIFFVLLLFPFL